MAICWERLSRQLFSVLILSAVLVVLVPFWCLGRDVELDCIGFRSSPFCLLFTFNPSSGPSPAFESWSGHGTPKAFSECRRHETGRAREGECSLAHKGGLGDLARENFRFRKAVDAFLLHLECNFGL